MKLFECQHCGQQLYFENTHCEQCGYALGYLCEDNTLLTLQQDQEDHSDDWTALTQPQQHYRYCANAAYDACNWLLDSASEDTLCRACQLNRTIPDLSNPDHLAQWRSLEIAKHRLVYTLLRLRLPLRNKTEAPERGLAFDFLAELATPFRETAQVITGHAQGVITINIAEADDAERERQRQNMAEPYRTLLGHMRHEVGHYYWEHLLHRSDWLEPYRALFGDERQDYGEALDAHYSEGPQSDWAEQFISAYASSHPWEDWAETWAHYLHIVDTLETAYAYGLRIRPKVGDTDMLAASADFDPYVQDDFDTLIDAWLPLTFAVNSLNRSMGQPDLYPFVVTPVVVDKLSFVHRFIRAHRGAARHTPATAKP